MSREQLINRITERLKDEDLTIQRTARFKKHPLRAAWFYARVVLNRYTPLLLPIVATTAWGHRLKAYETSAIGSVYFLGFYDADITLFLLKHYHEDGDILDVGANVGIYASLFSHLATSNTRVVAFEPTPSTAGVLRSNVGALTNVAIEQVALSDHTGEITFHDYGLRHGVYNSSQAQPLAFLQNQGVEITVASTTLDAYCAEHKLKPSLLKLDTEGTEDSILKHSTQTLKEYRPTILLELGGGEAWAAGIAASFTILEEHDYRFFNATREGALVPHTRKTTYKYENLIAIHVSNLSAYGIAP
jgi:FkbM family methyltransferase